jgi:hypothetical protein
VNRPIFTVAHVKTEDLAMPVCGHPGGDHDGLGHDP